MLIDDDIQHCLKVLREGGTLLYPTDTVWGIGCDATNEKAVDDIYKLKGRSTAKSMIILVADEDEIRHYTKQTSLQIFDYIKGISKPVTVIYDSAINLASNVINEDGSVGIRIVKDEFCKRLIREFGKPIVSTSSNVSGFPTPALFSDIDTIIRQGVDYVVQHRQNETVPGEPSTVIKLLPNGEPLVLRK